MKIYLAEGSSDPTSPAAARTEYFGGPLVIRENKHLRYATQDGDGNWSHIQDIELTNGNQPFKPSVGPQDLQGFREVRFMLPRDKDTFRVTCREFFNKALQLKVGTKEELEEAMKQAMLEVSNE